TNSSMAGYVAEKRSPNLTLTGNVGGTAPYMSPEQCVDLKSADARSDVYSFGLILFEMLTGRLPLPHGRDFEEWRNIHLEVSPDLRDTRIPVRLKSVIELCLSKDPTQRYPDFTTVRTALLPIYEAVLGQEAPRTAFAEQITVNQLSLKA